MNLTPLGSLDLNVQAEGSFFCKYIYRDTDLKCFKKYFNKGFQNEKYISEIKNIGTLNSDMHYLIL